MNTKILTAFAFITGLFLNTTGTVPSAEALTIPEETKKALSPIKSWYFTGRAQIGRTSGPFVARVSFDSRAKDMRSSSRFGKFPIKEFVLTTKDIYIVSRSGNIEIYDNSLSRGRAIGKDVIKLTVGGSIRGESTYQIKNLFYYQTCHGSKNDHCAHYILSDRLPKRTPGGRWSVDMKQTFYFSFRAGNISQLTDKPIALLRKPIKAPPRSTQTPPIKMTKLRVCMKAHNNKHYVVAEGDKKTVNANRPHCQAWEQHTLYDLNGGKLMHGDKIAVQTHWKRLWSAQSNGKLEADRTKLFSWEVFAIRKMAGPGGKVIGYGSKVAFLGHHNKYVVAEGAGGKNMNANRTKANQWETFTLMKP